MKAMTKQQLAQCAGVTVRTLIKEISAISAISAGHKKNYAYNQFYSDSLFRNAE